MSLLLLKNVIEWILCWKTGKWIQSKNFRWHELFLHKSLSVILQSFEELSLTFLIQPIWISDNCRFFKRLDKQFWLCSYSTLLLIPPPVAFSVGSLRVSRFCCVLALLQVVVPFYLFRAFSVVTSCYSFDFQNRVQAPKQHTSPALVWTKFNLFLLYCIY